jgi:hypothetical protein
MFTYSGKCLDQQRILNYYFNKIIKYKSISINLVCSIKRLIINNIKILQAALTFLSESRHFQHCLTDIDFHNKVSPSFKLKQK